MTDNIVALDFNGVKVVLDDNTVLIRMNIQSTTADTALTMHDNRDNTNYQVPTGKKATMIFIENYDEGAGGGSIFFADNADGTTNAVTLFQPNTTDAFVDIIFISAEIPADKFVNAEAITNNWVVLPAIWVIEENA